jgi:uncharacterized protein
MAKKIAKAKRGSKKRSKKPELWPGQILKLLLNISVLVVIVLGAAFLAQVLLDRPEEQTKPVQVSKPQSPPAFEVFPPVIPQVPKSPAPPVQLPEGHLPLVAIIIDDIGYDRPLAQKFMNLGVPFTLSFLPHAPFSRTILAQAHANGFEAMLHLPMEPIEYPGVNPGPGALLSSMTPDELIAQLEENISYLDGIKGVNNHMGSRMSASSEQMRQIFSILKKKSLYYVDSRTGAQTAAPPSARLLQLPFAERDIFIDHLNDPEFIRSQMRKLAQRARKQGYAIGIAHPHQTTYDLFEELMPEFQQQVQLVPASMVVKQAMIIQATRAALAGDEK